MEIEEEFISGFCITCNGGQTVCCEYTMEEIKEPSHLWIVHMTDV